VVEAGEEARRRALVIALDHTGLSVGDLDAARGFYERAFGFALEHAFDLPGGIRGAMLRLESGGRLELFEHPEPDAGLTPGSPLEALATRGYGHFAVSAPDIEALFARALEAGATEKVSPRPSPEPGVRFAFLADPEGNLVELVER
jgi:catechol 2,3-dioxygenase-like lactoylglutathione lyase family enzyme